MSRPPPSAPCAQHVAATGIKYDPDRLAAVLADKWPQVYGRALKISALLGGWTASIAQVRADGLGVVVWRMGGGGVDVGSCGDGDRGVDG